MKVSSHKALVNVDGRAAARSAERAVRGQVARVVAYYAIFRGDFRAEDDVELIRSCGAMQAGGDEEGDALGRDAGGVQARQQRRKSDGVWRGARDVTNGDSGGALAGSQLGERRAADGVVECGVERLGNVVERRSRADVCHVAADALRNADVDAEFTEGEAGFHASMPRRASARACVLILRADAG